MKDRILCDQTVFWPLLVTLLTISGIAHGQQSLWFGTVKMSDKVMQGRFELVQDSLVRSIVYAPYGFTPTRFTDVTQKGGQLSFTWPGKQTNYQCVLDKLGKSAYRGNCLGQDKQPIPITIREFTKEDAILQGDTLLASVKDLHILDRALSLLNKGSNWNRLDNRICDSSSYPYQWSLFCALHQASIDVDAEYRHLRPVNQAVRQAIDEFTKGKKYAHLLQDFNNEAPSFEEIFTVLNRAKAIIKTKIEAHK